MKKTDKRRSINLSVRIKTLRLENPTILASGILGLDVATMERVVQNGAGAVTMKSVTLEERRGHDNPIFIQAGNDAFMNAVGYANKGIRHALAEFGAWKSATPLIGSIVGSTPEEFAMLAVELGRTPIKALEIVLSCPHTPGFGLLAGQGSPKSTGEITKAVRKVTKLPLSVKLSPSIEAVGEVAKAAEAEGADIINMGNTLGPGMKIDINRAAPVLHFKVGGVSGPAIRPIMIRCVYDLYKSVKIPIIATGGIVTGEDAVEAFMAGASAVGIGTGIYIRGLDVFAKVNREIEEFMRLNGYGSITQLTGLAHHSI